MTQSILTNISTHPKIVIENAVRLAVTLELDAIWEPRVVRHIGKRSYGSLSCVDYVVPCFELVNGINASLLSTVKKLAKRIESDETFDKTVFKVEAVGGYLNFYLRDEYLHEVTKQTIQWYLRPHFVNGLNDDAEYLILGPNIYSNANTDIHLNAYRIIKDLHNQLEESINCNVILGDYSEEAIDWLAVQLVSNASLLSDPRTAALCRRKAKDMISKNNEAAHKKLEGAHLKWLKEHGYIIEKLHVYKGSNNITTESSLASQVHDFLDERQDDMTAMIIRDEANKAVHYVNGGEYISLRSASGVLYRSAYLLFLVHSSMAIKVPERATTLVVIAPQALHTFIRSYHAVSAQISRVEQQLVCFDPKVSQSDVRRLQGSEFAVKQHFNDIAEYLHNDLTKHKGGFSNRRELINFVDLPVEISHLTASYRFPALFDVLAESVEILETLRAK